MTKSTARYTLSVEVPLSFGEAVERTRAELAKQGFGVLTEIDVKATFKQKLDVDFRPYIILGACNPPLAYEALTAERDIGVLLPCNVAVYQSDQPSHSTIVAVDPVAQLRVSGNAQLEEIAADVRARIQRALSAVAA